MKKKNRYHVKDPLVDKKHGILKNKFKITDKEKLQLIETDHLAEAYRKAVSEYGTDHTFTEKDIRHLHKLFLGAFTVGRESIGLLIFPLRISGTAMPHISSQRCRNIQRCSKR